MIYRLSCDALFKYINSPFLAMHENRRYFRVWPIDKNWRLNIKSCGSCPIEVIL